MAFDSNTPDRARKAGFERNSSMDQSTSPGRRPPAKQKYKRRTGHGSGGRRELSESGDDQKQVPVGHIED
ncbi:MAG: hypothetical protein JFAIHJKO_01645 [Pyrinomonadaceae bacterium]|nr:hypothetical protein [Pyrinomonadaceae bacterium]